MEKSKLQVKNIDLHFKVDFSNQQCRKKGYDDFKIRDAALIWH